MPGSPCAEAPGLSRLAPGALGGSLRLRELEPGRKRLVLEILEQAEAVVVEPGGQAVPVSVQVGERIVPRGPHAAFSRWPLGGIARAW